MPNDDIHYEKLTRPDGSWFYVQSFGGKKRNQKSLVDKLAEAAWATLNHDNDPHDGQPHNAANWRALCERIKAVLKEHRT